MPLATLLLSAALHHAPVIATPVPEQAPSLLILSAGEARCAGREEQPTLSTLPHPGEIRFVPPAWRANAPAFRLTFRIDATGRPLSIAAASADGTSLLNVQDLVPSFATWRFAPGPERSDCEIVFAGALHAAAEVPLPVLYRFFVLGRPSRTFREAVGSRLTPAGSTCFPNTPAVRQRAYPAFDEIAQAPGTSSFALVGFDIDARGTPTAVSLVGTSGNAALDRQSLDAIRRSRFAPGERRGCTYPYWRRSQELIAAPAAPEAESFRPSGATCRDEDVQWSRQPRLTFPREFEERRIEGWAVLRYDVAPWGEIGNIEVAAAEPAERFGTQAAAILRSGRLNPGAGATGCTIRFRFRLPGRDGDADGAPN